VGWPRFLEGSGPEEHVRRRGGEIVGSLDDADYLVVGKRAKRGRAEALRRAARLSAQGAGPQQLGEGDLVRLLRPRVAGKTFLLAGGLPVGVDPEGAASLLKAAGARVATPSDADVDFVVVGVRRAKGKAEALRRIAALREAGVPFTDLEEPTFLVLLACLAEPDDSSFDAHALAVQLRTLADARKVERAIRMLKSESFRLHTEVTGGAIGGVVRSQSQEDGYYACWIFEDGSYGCFDAKVNACMGQSGGLCKHLMVLLLGLAVQGEADPRQVCGWLRRASSKRPSRVNQRSAELILRYKGAEAGEIDWRPTETVPEDYYAL
jgi:hypothetical protein